MEYGGLQWVASDCIPKKQKKRQQNIEIAKNLRAQGKTQQQIATEMKCSLGTVNGLLKTN